MCETWFRSLSWFRFHTCISLNWCRSSDLDLNSYLYQLNYHNNGQFSICTIYLWSNLWEIYYLAHKYTNNWEVMLLQKCLSLLNKLSYINGINWVWKRIQICRIEKKRKLKFDKNYWRYEIMEDISTNRCPYIYEQDDFQKHSLAKKYRS